jgi:hypothetical protein
VVLREVSHADSVLFISRVLRILDGSMVLEVCLELSGILGLYHEDWVVRSGGGAVGYLGVISRQLGDSFRGVHSWFWGICDYWNLELSRGKWYNVNRENVL